MKSFWIAAALWLCSWSVAMWGQPLWKILCASLLSFLAIEMWLQIHEMNVKQSLLRLRQALIEWKASVLGLKE